MIDVGGDIYLMFGYDLPTPFYESMLNFSWLPKQTK